MNDSVSKLFQGGGKATWLNHYSAQVCAKMNVPISAFDFVGIDGFLLRGLLRLKSGHTSADADLPSIIQSFNPTVGLIGGTEEDALAHKVAFESHFPQARVLWSINGYGESSTERFTRSLMKDAPKILIIGLGPGLQEMEALRLARITSDSPIRPLIVTCGGWLDQLAFETYYPRFAIALNLRWLVRLARDPKRLWKRYTLWALLALIRYRKLRKFCERTKAD